MVLIAARMRIVTALRARSAGSPANLAPAAEAERTRELGGEHRPFSPQPVHVAGVGVGLRLGQLANQTIRFAFDGTDYEIDLNAKFSRQLALYVEHARRAGRAQSHRPGRTAANRQRSDDIRAWAKEHGLAVSERGRILASVWNSTTRPAGTSASDKSARCRNRALHRTLSRRPFA
jgi:hypothetical protein